MKKLLLVCALAGIILALWSCVQKYTGPTIYSDSVTMVEIAEATASGVINATSATGYQAQYRRSPAPSQFKSLIASSRIQNIFESRASAANSVGGCPTIEDAVQPVGGNCIASGTNILQLVYNPCTLFPPYGIWSGAQVFTSTAGPTTFQCGFFPTFTNTDVVNRTFSVPTSRIPTTDGTQTSGVVVVLLDTSGNTSKVPVGFSPSVLPTGETIVYGGPTQRNIFVNGLHVAGTKNNYRVWDFVITTEGNALIAVNGANVALSGTLRVQDTVKGIVVDAVISNLGFTAGCGVPTSGTVTTTVVSGPGIAETLGFTGTCGQGTYAGSQPINLVHSF